MLEKFKNLELKYKITYPIYALASIIIGISCILFFFGAFDIDTLTLITGILLIVICVASMFNVYKKDKKTFIINIIYIVILITVIILTQLF